MRDDENDKPDGIEICRVYTFPNGMVAAFDQHGEQIPYYQGRKEDVWHRIMRDKTPKTVINGR